MCEQQWIEESIMGSPFSGSSAPNYMVSGVIALLAAGVALIASTLISTSQIQMTPTSVPAAPSYPKIGYFTSNGNMSSNGNFFWYQNSSGYAHPIGNYGCFAGVIRTSGPLTLTRNQSGYLIIQSSSADDITLPATTTNDVGMLNFTIMPDVGVGTSKIYPANGEKMFLANWDVPHAYAQAAEGRSFHITLMLSRVGLWQQCSGPSADGTLGWNPQD
jgi:hypothetical protein